jgi:hypothetical protein
MARPAGLLLLAFLAGGSAAAAEPPALLPEVRLHLSAARYAPVDPGLHWVGWIDAGVGVVRAGSVTLDFAAAVETTLGNTRRAFEATQANYHLTPSLRRPFGRLTGALVFHHVSRHYVDREKERAVDWNVLGLRLGGPLGGAPRGRWEVGLGHTTLASLVGYEWEATALLEADARTASPTPYGRAEARLVTVGTKSELDRGGFIDATAEAGLRVGSPVSRNFQFFAALERRNDVFLEVAGRRTRGLFGFRINYLGP